MSSSYTSVNLNEYTTSYPSGVLTNTTHTVAAPVLDDSFDNVMSKMASNLYRPVTLGVDSLGIDVLSRLFGDDEYEITLAASVENIVSDFLPDSDKTLSRDIAKSVVQDIFQSMRKELDIHVNL